jgi:hypothetical protein
MHRPRHRRGPPVVRLGHRAEARLGADHRGPQAALRHRRGERADARHGRDQRGWVQGGDGGGSIKAIPKALRAKALWARHKRQRGHDVGKGRWPANLIHDGSDEVVGLFPKTAQAWSGNVRTKPGQRKAYLQRAWHEARSKGTRDRDPWATPVPPPASSTAPRRARRIGMKGARGWAHDFAPTMGNWHRGQRARPRYGNSKTQPPPHRETHRPHALPLPPRHTTGRRGARPVHGQRQHRQGGNPRRLPVHRHRTRSGIRRDSTGEDWGGFIVKGMV